MGQNELGAIEQFVDSGYIGDTLIAAGFNGDEAAVATVAIQHERAQLLVDAAAQELGKRAIDLRQERLDLTNRVAVIDNDLKTINAAVKRKSPNSNQVKGSIEYVYEWGSRLKELVSANTTSFTKLIKDEPPFTLWIGEKKGIDAFSYEYTVAHLAELANCAISTHAVSQAYGCFVRDGAIITIRNRELATIEERPEYSIIYDGRKSTKPLAIEVKNPAAFFRWAVEDLKFFGQGAAKAVLAVAYLQRQQYIEAYGSKVDTTSKSE
jgi:hypothetical protein